MLDKLMQTLQSDKTIKTVEWVRDPGYTIKVTRRLKPFKMRGKEDLHEDLVVQMGPPAYRTRDFIADCKAVKEPFPVKKFIVKYWPKKKAFCA